MSDTSTPSPAPKAPQRGGSTRAKLVSLTLLANMAGFVVAIFVARTLRAGRVADGGETLWLAVYYTAMFVVAVFDAFLVDELLFGGTFRRTYLQGQDARQLERSGDDEQLASSFRGSRMGFPTVAIICGGLTYLLFNLVNDDFDTYHRTIGTHLSALRSEDPERQRAAVAELSIRRAPPVLPALTATLAGEGPAAPWAAWALGRFHDLPTQRPLITPLVGAARSQNPEVRHEALVALGRLQHRPSAPYIHEEIRRQLDADQVVDARLLYALGNIQKLESLPVLEELLHAGDEDTQRMAAWALAQHRDQRAKTQGGDAGRTAVTLLERRLPSASLNTRCAIIHALGILADERSNLALMQAYDAATPDEHAYVCPRITLALRPDGGDDEIELLRPERKLGMKIILSMAQMRATTPELRAKVEPWLVALSGDSTAPYEVIEGGASLLEGIRSGRDDAKAKSVDQALGIEDR